MARALKAPQSGITVRMYRQGHGDCFLLCTKDANDDPYYILIDCGLINGSQIKGKQINEIAQHIADSTKNHINLVVITHEHQDHVSGFTASKSRKIFDKITFDKLWLPWTEDPDNNLANSLRTKYKDTLINLMVASKHMQNSSEASSRASGERIREFLNFDVDEDQLALYDQPTFKFSAKKIKGITIKKAMKYVIEKAKTQNGVDYLRPHTPPVNLPNVDGIRVFVMGPPENEAKLRDLDPHHDEGFELTNMAFAQQAIFSATKTHLPSYPMSESEKRESELQHPFASYYRIAEDRIHENDYAPFFYANYLDGTPRQPVDWRKIDNDWLDTTENFALRMGNYINNTSLVLAFELPVSKKVLLFVGDAQRGNWASWHDKKWTADNGDETTAEDLLNRTVLYKVGHHGSHNATLSKGGLDMMAKGEYEPHFVAMIPANPAWALHKTHPWVHPLPQIYDALREKTKGRLMMSGKQRASQPASTSDEVWDEFKDLSIEGGLYIEYKILDEL